MFRSLDDATMAEIQNDSGDEGNDDEETDLDYFIEENPEYSSSSSSGEGEESDDDNIPLSMLAAWEKKPFNGKPLPEDVVRDPVDIFRALFNCRTHRTDGFDLKSILYGQYWNTN